MINGTARQPEAQSKLQSIAWIGFGVTEVLAIIGIALAFVFRYLSHFPLTDRIQT